MAKKAKAAPAVKVTVDGKAYVWIPQEATAFDVRELRRQCGWSVRELMEIAESSSADIDVAAAIVWLARRQTGELTLSYKTVAEGFTYETDLGLDVATEAEAPEA